MKLAKLLRTPAILLALLGAGLVALCIRSFFRYDVFACHWIVPDDPTAKVSPFVSKSIAIWSGRGGLSFLFSQWRQPSWSNPPRPVIYGSESLPNPDYPGMSGPGPGVGPRFQLLGFGYSDQTIPATGQRVSAITLPTPVLIAMMVIVPTWWLRAHRETRRKQCRRENGQCVKCGYDLRASKDRCPECGEPISSVPV